MRSRLINRFSALVMAAGSLGILVPLVGIYRDLTFLEYSTEVKNAHIPVQIGFGSAGTACLLLCLYASWLLFRGWNARRFTIAFMATIAIVMAAIAGSTIGLYCVTGLFFPVAAIGTWIGILGGAGTLRLCYVILHPAKDSAARHPD